MKSRTSFFNATVFKKNLTRFAPAWGIYTVILVLAVITNLYEDDRAGSWLLDLAMIEIPFLFCYAHVCTQLLFGDLLYNTRMCNALHAMPLKRETWFVTNIASGFAFFLIPGLVATGFSGLWLMLMGYPGNMAVVPLFLLNMTLAFVCFFGISTFSAFFAGNRFAHGVVYGLLNFGSMILYWLVGELYISMYYGVKVNEKAFMLFAPFAQMLDSTFLEVERKTIYVADGVKYTIDGTAIYRGDNFAYFFLAAAAGLALILVGLWLYRRRKLESAGDFLALRGLKPVFSVVYTLSVGALFAMIFDDLYLIVGLIVGWFTGRMLLERTVRVFRKKNILHGCAVIGIFLLSLGIALLDPLGIETWIPEARKVVSVTIREGNEYYSDAEVTVTSPQDVERVLQLHQGALDEHFQGYPHEYTYDDAYKELIAQTNQPDEMDRYLHHTLIYRLESGRTVTRYYRIWMGDEDGQFLKTRFSTPEAVFGYEEDPDRFLAENSSIRVRDAWQGYDAVLRNSGDITGLYLAMLADAREGNLTQVYAYHRADRQAYWIYLENDQMLTIYSSCTHTLNWLRSYGLNVDEVLREIDK